ncbi:MAG: ribulose-phosphate 3-epimerase, partial [Actinomycetes bacterium]|nr:ribulose-phosphate 3-epimerase [Actinomycetes bacterium]MDX5381002.1 ribulose-phosphate 3-epimerase [Actinomycetes bacterium]MDX5400152.1 ribulose-phosphate 3-epimerase [Actinomycetes bacterium]MDX5450762.1 ribulose-phosphate 3-epimerase [Actinomycetes bacterium]
MGIVISPSILNADYLNLGGEVERISNADYVHVDVMDNHFVPNLSMGSPTVEALVAKGTLPVDAHLMIEEADRWAPVFADLGCYSVSFHAEATTAPVRL